MCTMGLLSRRQRSFVVFVLVVYFMSIVFVFNYTVESDNVMKAMNGLQHEVGSLLKNSHSQQRYLTMFIMNVASKDKGQFATSSNGVPNVSSTTLDTATLKLTSRHHGLRLKKKYSINKYMDKLDWNDYQLMARESLRQGPGEQGQGYNKNFTAEELQIMNELKERYKYNVYASDQISLQRSVNDTRTDICKKKLFLKNIPELSVSFVVIFSNERNTTLLRTIHGIVNRSPKKLLREIVMVDDCSTDKELKAPLDEYIAKHFTKVKLVRNNERQGLIRSRIIGADHSSGSFIIFLDAHIEVNFNFLPPLIEPMVLDYRTIVCPVVDVIDKETLQIRISSIESGAFDWGLVFQRLPVTQEDLSEPLPVASIIGCAMAITRRWWEEIGKFDPGLDIWGGEQFEISFKSWMCGGKVVDALCSRVAHLYRSLPYVVKESYQKNFLRVATVWMDEYKEYFLQRRPWLLNTDPGNITSQLELRKRLKCKSFDWFMKEVAPDIPQYFPLIEPPVKAWGKIKSNYNQTLCVTTQPQWLSVVKCDQADVSQYRYEWHLQIREHYANCFTNPGNDYVLMWSCFLVQKNPDQKFVWDRMSGRIANMHTKLCLDYKTDTLQVYMTPCLKSSVTQSWIFEVYNSTIVDSTWEQHKHLFNITSIH